MALVVVALFWVLVVVAVAATVFVMALLDSWGSPQPVRSMLDHVGLLSDADYAGSHRGWSR